MLVPPRIKYAFAFWVVAEVLAFVAVVDLVGLGDAILLGICATVLGFALLKRSGAAALVRLRALASGQASAGAMVDDTLATFGAVALIVPGFLSDLIGLALILPGVRSRAAMIVGKGMPRMWKAGHPAPGAHDPDWSDPAGPFDRNPPRHGPSAIDLEPGDWQRTR